MAVTKSAPVSKRNNKTDLPPFGDANRDPLTDEPGAHPIEAGIGAALGGAAAGFGAGMLGGPVGAVAGAVIGGVAGGLGGKAVGESIDPTIATDWYNDYLEGEYDYADESTERDHHRPAFDFGVDEAVRNPDKTFEQQEKQLEAKWVANGPSIGRTWTEARSDVRAGFERAQAGHAWTEPI